MPIVNIVDERRNKYDVNVMAILEDAWHDNCIDGATYHNSDVGDEISYIGIQKTTIENIIKLANEKWGNIQLTLFLYDVGENNYFDYVTITKADDGSLSLVEKILVGSTNK